MAWHAGALLLVGGAAGWAARAEQPPQPTLELPLKPLGFPGYASSLLHAQGASMSTVHLLDANHVLLTYSRRSLIPRIPGDDPEDSDREVEALLLELPQGKVLDRTTWRLHDHGQYLWELGEGVFALRMGKELSVFAPMDAFRHGTPAFQRTAMPHRVGVPVLVSGSPDGRFAIVEVEHDEPPTPRDDDPRPKRHYTLEFFRLSESPASPTVHLTVAGAVGSPVALRLPADGDGYLWAEDAKRGQWQVSFNEYHGRQQTLAPVLSSCPPRLTLLSRGEFLAQTCRTDENAPMLASYGFDGHENWEEQLGATLQAPTLITAPRAARFAISTLTASSEGAPVNGMGGNEDPLVQEIRVYQNESGDMLLRLQCAQPVRSAQNFDLSPDGRSLAVMGPDSLRIYSLPALNGRDRKALADVQQMLPPEGSGPVILARITRPVQPPEAAAAGGAESAGAPGRKRLPMPKAATDVAGAAGGATAASPGGSTAAASGIAATSATSAVPVSGGVPDTQPSANANVTTATLPAAAAADTQGRKPPTLLNPGENAEYNGQHTSPNE